MVASKNEAQSRIQINAILAQAGWVLDANSDQHLVDKEVREIINSKKYADLNTHSSNLLEHFKAIPEGMRDTILSYIKNNIEIEKFA